MDDDDDYRVYNRNFRIPKTPVRSRPTPGSSLTPTRGIPTRTHPYRRKFSVALICNILLTVLFKVTPGHIPSR
jgi:hypothetical protein